MPDLLNNLGRLRSSIAYYPALIALGYVVLAVAVLGFESTSLAARLRELLTSGLYEPNTAREIFSTLIASVVSLAVFSFSMVMVVLNGAASRLSPRVLPGLISDTRNRVFLGVNLGSVLYFMIMVGVIDQTRPESVPTLGTVLALVSGTLCMVLFVVFIRSTSQSIRVDWVVNQLFDGARAELDKRKALLDRAPPPPDDAHWWCLTMRSHGYLREVDEHRLAKLLSQRDLMARLQVEPGFFLVEGHPLARFSEPLSNEEACAALACFDFSNDEFASHNVTYGMRQLTEIAVKAISPAINDPGTAIRAANLLGVLLAGLMGVPDYRPGCFVNGRPLLYYRELSTDGLLFAIIGPFYTYGASDPQVMIAVLNALRNALLRPGRPDQLASYEATLHALREAVDKALGNSGDRHAVNHMLIKLNALGSGIRPLALLPIPCGN